MPESTFAMTCEQVAPQHCGVGKHSFMKFFGRCNDLDREMRQCLKKEYQENRAKSRAHAEAMRQKLMSPPEQ